MKKYILLTSLVFMTAQLLCAQVKPKHKQKEAAPTQKEMEDMMKEAQKELAPTCNWKLLRWELVLLSVQITEWV